MDDSNSSSRPGSDPARTSPPNSNLKDSGEQNSHVETARWACAICRARNVCL